MFGNKFGVGVLKHPGYNGKGGGGGGTTQSTGTTYTTNLPEYAQPYVESMLGATQRQLFTGAPDETGNFNITGFQPYKPYSTNMQDYIAPFSPLQQQAQVGAGNLRTPGQFGTASGLATMSGIGSMNAGADYARQATNPYAVGAYMNPYLSNALAPQLAEMGRQGQIAQQQAASQATTQGAFGGTRGQLAQAEAQRNTMNAQQNLLAQGYNQAFQQAQAAQQFGANLGLQGMGQAGQAASTLGSLGGQELAAQQGILGTQAQMGATQQAQQQQMINQAIQDYANAQQYPMMQLGMMSNMLRGLPMQAVTTQTYQAQPNLISQGIGALGTGYALQNAMGSGKTAKAGGIMKSYAKGGIASIGYDVGGEVEHDLHNYPIEKLKEVAETSESKTVRDLAKAVLKEKSFAPGGVIAFKAGSKVDSDALSVDELANLVGAEETPMEASGAFQARPNANRISATQGNYAAANPSYAGIMAPMGPRLNDVVNAPVPAAKPAPVVTKPAPAEEKLVAEKPDVTTRPAAPAAYMPTTKTVEEGILSALPQAAQDYLRNKPTEEDLGTIAARNAKQREEFLGPDTATADYRKKIMAERANSADEAKRQEYMRMAEFFSTWGSTPGPTLVAGMTAAKSTIPNLISDKKDQKKAEAEMDKIIYQLDQASRLEKKGDWEQAAKIKEDQTKAVQNWAGKWVEAGISSESNRTRLEAERMGNVSAEKIAAARDKVTMATSLSRADQILANKEKAIRENYDNALKNGTIPPEMTIDEYIATRTVGGSAIPQGVTVKKIPAK